ncbi:hypothetical protein [Acinetobacter entericus]|uniref:Uncharacterized protein n=1 Tax=Acinetobacter entericus TaxID=2989714 RepID=A0ABT3NNR6_9GAMM|nr:hypothetical protein [Acinetobacter entericus]MCW8041186.1 hypothetical protein [Acinetobacter entericus]
MFEINVGAESQLHNIRESMDFLKRKPTVVVGWMEFIVMDKPNHLTIESLHHDPRSHMVNHLIFNGITDANILINATDELMDFIGEKGLFNKATPEEILLSRWRRSMVDRLMRQGLTDANLIIGTANRIYDFLISEMIKDQKKTRESFNALREA